MSGGALSSIIYNGHNFAPYATAEVELAPAVARVRALEAPGAPRLPIVELYSFSGHGDLRDPV